MRRTNQAEKGPNGRFRMVWPMFLMIVWTAMWPTGPGAMAATTADELYREGKFEEAEKRYAEGDMDHPKDIRYRYNRGCAAYQKGDFQSATAAFASVMRRTEEKEMRFRAAYNLGNVAFKQGDFASAAASYKQALRIRPEAEDARYNLELALREMEKKEKQKQEQQQKSNETGQKGDGSEGDQQEKQQDKAETQGEKSEPQKKEPSEDKQTQGEPKEKEEAKHDRTESSDAQQAKQEETPKDLSGELAPMKQMDKEGEQDEKAAPEGSAAMMDRKKAEALLDNVKEDRSRFLRYQLSKEKRHGPQSGKDW